MPKPHDRRRRSVGCFGALLAALLPARVVQLPRASAAQTFERWQPPTPVGETERDLLRTVRRRALRYNVHLHHDARLTQSAAALLPWARAHAGETMSAAQLQAVAWQQGIVDGELSAVAVRASGSRLAATLAEQVDGLLADDSDLNQVGVAMEASQNQRGAEITAVVALSRRLLSLAPMPATLPINGTLRLHGRVLDPHIDTLRLAVERPAGTLQQQNVSLDDTSFSIALPVGDTGGTLRVQLLVERGHGPEVAVMFPLSVGVPQAAAGPAACPDLPPHRSLIAWLYGLRQAHGVALPMPSVRLTQLAQAHADDMAAHHFFAHVSAAHGDAAQRLSAAGLRYERVVENLAMARGGDEAFEQWRQSPSHLANLLDPHVDHVGIGVAPAHAPQHDAVIVLLMARLP